MSDVQTQRATITIAPQLQRQLDDISTRLGQSIEEIADAALRAHLDELSVRILEAEERAYQTLYPELRRHYANQVVAIADGQVIDVDADFETLYLRVYRKIGERAVLIRRVGDTPEETYSLRSPRMDHGR